MGPQTFHSRFMWTLILAAFASVGWFIGWLIGSSNSPVVAGALPLVFGLIGGFSFRYLERRVAEDSYAQKLEKLTSDAETRAKIAEGLGLNRRVSWLPAFWSLNIIIFCVSSYFGVKSGVDYRLGSRQTLTCVLKRAGVEVQKLSGDDRIALQNALLRLRALRLSDEEINDIFVNQIKLIVDRPKNSPFGSNLILSLNGLFPGLETSGGAPGPGPAAPPY